MRIFRALVAPFLVVYYFFSAVTAGTASAEENIRYQQERMAYLENEYYENYTPGDENRFTSFDIDEAIRDGVKYNQLQFLATHNSYQLLPTEESGKLYGAISDLTFGLVGDTSQFENDTLTDQFEVGIRSIEIDIETVDDGENVSFIVTHNPLYDNTSSCYDFSMALEEIKMWSDNNPGHLPVTVIVEPKKLVPPVNNMKNFSLEYAKICDELIREKMGNTLLTPDDMMGEYESLKEMRENDGWLTLEQTMGKVIFLLHDNSAISDYISLDKTLRSQAMFPMLRYNDRNKPYTAFIIDNNSGEALRHEEETIGKCNLVVRVRADAFPTYNEKNYERINSLSAQIISTDFPVRKGETQFHQYSFDGYTVKLQK